MGWGEGVGEGGVMRGWGGVDCLWSWRTVRLRTPVSQGWYPFEAKKRGPKKGFWVWGRIWRGVPVLTTYTPPARGLGGFVPRQPNTPELRNILR